jgi:hypothetical protein
MTPLTARQTIGWLAALALVCGCASAPPRMRRCPTRRPARAAQTVEVTARGEAAGSGGSSGSVIGATTPPPPAQPAPVQPVNEERTTTTSTGTSEPSDGDDEECAPEPESASQPTPREGTIAAYEAQIERERQGMAAGMAECRDICRAAGSICTAATEICRLAGDADARCTRARGACVDAGRARDGACPTCPPVR